MMVKLISPTGATINTDLTIEIRKILESEGFKWFEILQKSELNISETAFQKIDTLISNK